MPVGCLLIAATIALLVFGWKNLQDAVLYRHQVTMTYSDFAKAPPQTGWYGTASRDAR